LAARSTATPLAGAVNADPRLNFRQHPDLALRQLGDRSGKVGPRGELLDPLATHAEHGTDLVRTHERNGLILHSHDYRRKTREPSNPDTSSRVNWTSCRPPGWPPTCARRINETREAVAEGG